MTEQSWDNDHWNRSMSPCSCRNSQGCEYLVTTSHGVKICNLSGRYESMIVVSKEETKNEN